MAYIVNSNGCCHCKECWNRADVPHGTRDDGFEYNVLPEGFRSKRDAATAFELSRKERV